MNIKQAIAIASSVQPQLLIPAFYFFFATNSNLRLTEFALPKARFQLRPGGCFEKRSDESRRSVI
jgi:hypothetical protein